MKILIEINKGDAEVFQMIREQNLFYTVQDLVLPFVQKYNLNTLDDWNVSKTYIQTNERNIITEYISIWIKVHGLS